MSFLEELGATISERRNASPDSSWTARLLASGPEKCAEKFGEEAVEAIIEAVKGDKARLTAEAALAELERRQSQSGISEKASRATKHPDQEN